MRKLTGLAIGSALAMLCATHAGHAHIAGNGVSLNGMSLQGIALNGMNLQGVALNGMNLQGVGLNGMNLQGVRLNGMNLQGIERSGTTLTTDPERDGPAMNSASPSGRPGAMVRSVTLPDGVVVPLDPQAE